MDCMFFPNPKPRFALRRILPLFLGLRDDLGDIWADELLESLEHFCGFWEQPDRIFAIEILGKAATYGCHS